MSDVIEVASLTKTYAGDKGRPPLTAVAGIDFTVRAGEVFEALALAGFAAGLFVLAARVLARRVE